MVLNLPFEWTENSFTLGCEMVMINNEQITKFIKHVIQCFKINKQYQALAQTFSDFFVTMHS